MDLCSRIQNEAGKAGIAVAANLKMGFFVALSVTLQAILARIDFLMSKILKAPSIAKPEVTKPTVADKDTASKTSKKVNKL